MYKIAICIPTYKRPDLLRKTINSIIEGDRDDLVVGEVVIIVVDNDADKTAQDTVRQLAEQEVANFRLYYFSYPKKGLANVRNELLRNALTFQTDFIVFIDDDEHASNKWLNSLLYGITQNRAEIVLGPVISVLEKEVPEYLSHWFIRGDNPDNAELKELGAGNLIISTPFIVKHQLRFDERFNTTGAEDTYFGIQAMKAGAKILWAKEAITYEEVPADRLNLRWLWRRRYRGANTYTYILVLEKKYAKLVKKTILSGGYILIGGLGLTVLPFKIKQRYWGLLKVAEGLGAIAGLFNFKYHEYK